MNILLGCDGVLADFVGGVLAEFKHLGLIRRDKTHESITNWRIETCLGVDHKYLYHVAGAPGFCSNLKPIAGAIEGVQRLRRIGKVYAVTSPMHSSPTWVYARTRWLQDYFDFNTDEIVHTSAKHLVHGDVLVDDCDDTLVRWAAVERSRALPVLWDCPWNRASKHKGLMRTNSWEELAHELEAMRQLWE